MELQDFTLQLNCTFSVTKMYWNNDMKSKDNHMETTNYFKEPHVASVYLSHYQKSRTQLEK